jgi:Cu(I)/Ag(I) efflux system membrane fusion protein
MINFLSLRGAPGGRYLLLLLLVGLLGLAATACQKAKTVAKTGVNAADSSYYTCPMHPQVHEDGPGKCPICSMDLVKATKQAAPAVSASQRTSGGPAPAPEVMLTNQQIQLANIRVEALGTGTERSRTVLTGTLAADATQTSTVSSRVSGRVEHLFVRQTGEAIHRGAPLVAIYSEQLQALQQEYLLSLAQQRAVGENVNQYGRLVDAARQKLRLLGMSTGQLRTLAATGRLTPALTFYSPQGGLVQEVGVTEGQYVGEGTLLVSLTNLSSLWVEAQLYPEEVAGIRVGQSVQVQVAGFADSYTGKVIFLSPELQANSKVTLLRVQLTNPDGRLQPGMQANVNLAGPSSTALALPQGAVLRDSQGSYVWQQLNGNNFRRLKVTTGPETDQTVAITSGLDSGAKVVVSGAYLLESEYALYQGGDPMAGMDPNMPGMDMKKPSAEKKAPTMDPNMKM